MSTSMSVQPYASSWRQPGIGMPSSMQHTLVRSAPMSTTHAEPVPTPKAAHAASSCTSAALKPRPAGLSSNESTSEPKRRSNRSGSARTTHADPSSDWRRPSPGSPPPPQMVHLQICSSAESSPRSDKPSRRLSAPHLSGCTRCHSSGAAAQARMAASPTSIRAESNETRPPSAAPGISLGPRIPPPQRRWPPQPRRLAQRSARQAGTPCRPGARRRAAAVRGE